MQGYCKFKGGSGYDGEWENDKQDGFGTVFTSNGDRRNGLMLEGKMEGRGVWYSKNAQRIRGFSWERRFGEWENGKLKKWVVRSYT